MATQIKTSLQAFNDAIQKAHPDWDVERYGYQCHESSLIVELSDRGYITDFADSLHAEIKFYKRLEAENAEIAAADAGPYGYIT